jgi:rubrerythrin
MAEITNEIIEVIKESIELELNGKAFFEHIADATRNELGKKMFRKLANDEAQHLKVFSDMFTNAVGEDWKKQVNTGKSRDESPIIAALTKRVESAAKAGRSSELEAISIGMELERKAIDFFDDAAKRTTDTKAREIFNRITNEEKSHYDLLQAQYDYVSNSGYWFDIAEFRMDGKY